MWLLELCYHCRAPGAISMGCMHQHQHQEKEEGWLWGEAGAVYMSSGSNEV